jgi:hypothetical protein
LPKVPNKIRPALRSGQSMIPDPLDQDSTRCKKSIPLLIVFLLGGESMA